MRRLLLARHGQTAWNALGKLQGHTDIEIDDTGRAQARALASAIAHARITRVWSSDLARSRQTAEIVAAELGLPPPEIDPDLSERRFGIFEGLTREQCAAHHPEAWRDWLAQTSHPPGGEPREEAVARMHRALERILSEDLALVISHGGVMRLWLMDVLGEPVPLVGNAATYLVEHDGIAVRARLHDFER